MSALVFPFRLLRRGAREFFGTVTDVSSIGGGKDIAQKLEPGDRFFARGQVLLPQGSLVYQDFEDFWRARSGPYDPFLYKAQRRGAAALAEEPEVDAADQVDFYTSRRYVDVETLVVFVDDVEQVLGDDYDVINEAGAAYVLGTSLACGVRFDVAPGEEAVVHLEFEYYYPVRFEGDQLPEEQDLLGSGAGVLAEALVAVKLRETGPGYHLRNAPTAL